MRLLRSAEGAHESVNRVVCYALRHSTLDHAVIHRSDVPAEVAVRCRHLVGEVDGLRLLGSHAILLVRHYAALALSCSSNRCSATRRPSLVSHWLLVLLEYSKP